MSIKFSIVFDCQSSGASVRIPSLQRVGGPVVGWLHLRRAPQQFSDFSRRK
jgi:hypothetical protein